MGPGVNRGLFFWIDGTPAPSQLIDVLPIHPVQDFFPVNQGDSRDSRM